MDHSSWYASELTKDPCPVAVGLTDDELPVDLMDTFAIDGAVHRLQYFAQHFLVVYGDSAERAELVELLQLVVDQIDNLIHDRERSNFLRSCWSISVLEIRRAIHAIRTMDVAFCGHSNSEDENSAKSVFQSESDQFEQGGGI